jgi:transcriptional regulator with XRE-family HTH domain
VSLLADMALRQERIVEVLAQLREAHALSQEDAARKVGAITGRQWQRWEAGESMPRPRSLSAVAEAFSFPLSRFFDEEEAEQQRTPQLDRIETKLDALLIALGAQSPLDVAEELALELEAGDQPSELPAGSSASDDEPPAREDQAS